MISYTQNIQRRIKMCETNAYVYKNGNEELYLESVDIMKPEDGKIFMKNLFGEQRVFEGEIKEISFLKRRILLEKK